MSIRSLILAILTVILSSCASVGPLFGERHSPVAFERPAGRSAEQVAGDVAACNSAYQALSVKCMEAQGYTLVKNPN